MATPENNMMKMAAGVVAAGMMAGRSYGAGSEVLKVALLGCGGRGNGAVRNCLEADPSVQVVAVADLFENKAKGTREGLMKDEKYKGRINIPEESVYWGFECYKKIAKVDCDLVIMATAPAFRGRQLMEAIKAGKNVFTEKPVATDVAGCLEVMEAAKLAKEKKLAIVCGTQRRHEPHRVELMKKIHDGVIGELVGGQCYWFGDGIWYRTPEKGMSELEWQVHNWYHWTWLSGDQICEQHIHNIDVMNWCFDGPPKNFLALGGRCCRDYSEQAKAACAFFNNGKTDGWEKYNGNIWDHITAEFEYANGARVLSFSGHGPGTGRGDEKIVGTKGTSNCQDTCVDYKGAQIYKYEDKAQRIDPMVLEHRDLIASIRKGEPLNEGQRIAESTLTAIGARISAYTGQSFSWNALLKMKQNLVPTDDQLKAGPGIFPPIAKGVDKLF
ncbi:MAG TPA: Gfo/Idh/MocA family oxidoreductase [Candidatus Sumerlaeota bacterium]|nr:Gfo/Idh/MocA family oxidoreductase [Candidatus Sumerlaeota bacterium]